MRRSLINPFRSSTQLDPVLLDELAAVQYASLAVAALIGAVILLGWVVPAVGRALPAGWPAMKANTAILALLSAASLTLSHPRRSRQMLKVSRWLAILTGAIAVGVLVEYISGKSLGLDNWIGWRGAGVAAARMSPQSAITFALLSVVMVFLRIRKTALAYVIDLIAFAMSLLVLVFGSAYVFGAMHLTESAAGTRMSPQTLACVMLLCFVAFGRRAEYGVFSILIGVGIGSDIARVACPCALLMPFVIEGAETWSIHHGLVAIPVTIALGTALAAMLAFALVVIMAWRIDTLEKAIRELSLRDELTQLYNRRGFYLMAEQALALSQRGRSPFSVLFVDLDNLKLINDTLGHEVGSVFLAEVADLLRLCFRSTDVIGRIGGDEFVVAGDIDASEIRRGAERLEQAAEDLNAVSGRKYPLGVSIGFVTSKPDRSQKLEDLLGEADKAMYMTKRRKKSPPAAVWARGGVKVLD